MKFSIQDILTESVRLPYTSRSAWIITQTECPDLQKVHAHLIQGTRPSKQITNAKDIKHYLQVATIAKDGLLVVKRNDPLVPPRECIIIPSEVLEGLITALHIKLVHPTCHQLKKVMHRYFYALDMDKYIEIVTKSCHQCAALKKSHTK